MMAGTKEPATIRPAYMCQTHLRGRSSFVTILINMSDNKSLENVLYKRISYLESEIEFLQKTLEIQMKEALFYSDLYLSTITPNNPVEFVNKPSKHLFISYKK